MNVIRLVVVAAIAMAACDVAQAQSNRQFHDELFCHDFGMYAYTALADYRDGLPEDAALAKAHNYLCTDRIPQVCEIRRNTLQANTRLTYEKMGPGLHVRQMSGTQFLQFNEVNREQAVSACLSEVRSQR